MFMRFVRILVAIALGVAATLTVPATGGAAATTDACSLLSDSEATAVVADWPGGPVVMRHSAAAEKPLAPGCAYNSMPPNLNENIEEGTGHFRAILISLYVPETLKLIRGAPVARGCEKPACISAGSPAELYAAVPRLQGIPCHAARVSCFVGVDDSVWIRRGDEVVSITVLVGNPNAYKAQAIPGVADVKHYSATGQNDVNVSEVLGLRTLQIIATRM
jgi:hypothetical protein